MEVSTATITQLFGGWKQFEIPLFQRPYSWKRKHWNTLWDDIINLGNFQGKHIHPHFLGAIVTASGSSSPIGIMRHVVIDGQQRITTLSLLLCALRDTIPEEDTARQTRINSYLLNEGQDGLDRLKLSPTDVDSIAYGALATDPSSAKATSSNAPIAAAYQFFSKKLIKKQVIEPLKVLDIVESLLSFVIIHLGEEDNPYVIFESLNAKGEPLDQVDLIRNHFFMCFREKRELQRILHKDAWMPMQNRLKKDLTEYFRHSLMKDGNLVTKRNIYISFKDHAADMDINKMELLLRELKEKSKAYETFITPAENSIQTSEKVVNKLQQIRDLDFRTCFPLMLLLWDKFTEDKINEDDLCRCLDTIESLIIRRIFCKVLTNPLNILFLTLCKDLPEIGTANWIAERLATFTGVSRWPNNREFNTGFETFPIYASDLRKTKYILGRIERKFITKEPVQFDELEVEHIMPQTLSEGWKQTLHTDDIVEHQQYVHTMGNLTLTGYNQELSNLLYSNKKKHLTSSSSLSLNKYFTEEHVSDQWTIDDIKKRAKWLFTIAQEIWPHPGNTLS